ncbi:hypothetical protein Tco_0823848 [Tanacetum coccineum]|uniref:Uncharacterized protein n=1 Tax=Tanacetum coccineum TaxID=301880 RepID=A0ABQ5AP25_9ASTR
MKIVHQKTGSTTGVLALLTSYTASFKSSWVGEANPHILGKLLPESSTAHQQHMLSKFFTCIFTLVSLNVEVIRRPYWQ